MKKTIYILITSISLFCISDEKKELLLPQLGDRVSAAVSSSEERAIGKEFLKQI